ncbi:MAG: ATP-binding cassette domain-containing protein, partial [Tistlia sp.]
MSVSDSMIELEGLRLTYRGGAGPVEVLRGLDLSVAAGETVSIVGPSGSGKSSMMMLIAGLERPSAGRVAVGGVDFAGLDE